ncbi:origin recognition complex, subunit 4 [Wallemia mellicola]|nr:origin recognition complex, subunit 4 [Wallemia mellicola]
MTDNKKRQREESPGKTKTKKSKVAIEMYEPAILTHKQCLLATFYGWDSQALDEESENAATVNDLSNVIQGSVLHGEGNSALVVGGRGTGKSLAIQSALSLSSEERFIPIHLHGSVQTTDKMALREMARQIRNRGGTVSSLDALDKEDHLIDISQSTLTALLTLLSASALPIVVILNEFDLFATHARQALLYCLLDCAQGGQRRGGLAVIGTTCRYDAIDMLEKRVKSRFSQRVLHVSSPRTWTEWSILARNALSCEVIEGVPHMSAFEHKWEIHINALFKDPQFDLVLKMLFDMSADVQTLYRVLAIPIANMTTETPFPSAKDFLLASMSQRPIDAHQLIDTLPLPALALVIAAKQISSRDIDQFTFELVNKEYDDWARKTIMAPTSRSIDITSTGARVNISVWPKHVLMGAFDTLVDLNIFVPVASANAIASGEMREYCKHRCSIENATFKVALNSDGDGSALAKNFKTPAKASRSGKENLMSVGRPGNLQGLKTPLPSKKLFGEVATTAKSKKTTMTGLTPAPPKTVLRPAAGTNIQKNKDPSPRPSTLRKSARVPTHQVKATPAPVFIPLQDDGDIGPTQMEIRQEENEQALLQQEMEEEAYHESDWSDFEPEYAPPKEAQQEMPWRPLDDDIPDYKQLGRQLRVASPRFSVYDSDDQSYNSDEITDLKKAGGLDENLELHYNNDMDDDLGIKIRDRKPEMKKRVVVTKAPARKPLTTQRRPLNTQNKPQTKPVTQKIKLDDIKIDLDLDNCLLDE